MNSIASIRALWFGLVAVALVSFYPDPTPAGVFHDPRLHWKTLETPHFLVHYHDGEETLARRAAAIAEGAHAGLAPLLNWTPAARTELVLSDRMDLPNGFATPFPSNRMTIFVTPPDELNTLEDHGGWLETVITHEYAHILHLDKVAGAPRLFRRIFGRFPLPFPSTFPNAYQPLWLIEGLATHIETDRARGWGRGQSSYFDMLMRMEVEAGIKPLRQVNQPIASWPGGLAPYLYGVEFHNFVAARKGEDRIFRLVENYSNDFLPYSINTNSKRVLGQNLTRLWREFAEHLDAKHGPVLADIQARGLREGAPLTDDGYFGGPVRALPDGGVVYLRNDGRGEPRLLRLHPGGEVEHLAYVHHGARFHVHPAAGALVAQPEQYRNANYFYDLYRVDLQSGRKKRLTRGARYRFGAFSPDGGRIAAVHGELGRDSLHLLDARGRHPEVVSEMEEDVVLSELDWSPDGRALVAAVWRPAGGWNLERFDLAAGRWERLTRDAAIEAQPRYSADGRSILFTSDAGGVYNLRRLDLVTGAIVTLTNVRGGAFYPSATATDVYYSGYSADGFDLYRLALRDASSEPAPLTPDPVVRTTATDAFAGGRIRNYAPWASVLPRWWFPHLVVEEDRTEVGVTTGGWDTLQRHIYALDVAYDSSNDNFVGSVDYLYDRWYPVLKLHAGRTSDFERDDDADLLRVRREDLFQAELVLPFLFYRRDYSLHATAFQELASDDRVAPGVLREPDTEDNVVGAALLFDSTRRYPLSISRSHGRQIALVAEDSDAIAGSDYTGDVYLLDWREFLPLGGENVLALRFVQGWGTQTPRPFELGGADGASVNSALAAVLDTATAGALFNQRDYALRGYPTGLPALAGRRMQLASLEWRFPVRRVERGFMVPFPGAMHQVHGALFADTGAAWDEGGSPDRYFTGAGAEALVDLILLYTVPVQLRAGYAHGFDAGGDDRVYLRAGAAF